MDEIESGFSQIRNPKSEIRNYEKILDRKDAIKKAIEIAKPEDVVIITGKGSEPWMCLANGKKIPWSDKKIVKEILENK
jgi:UDP-N-acetylmuramoyl-L-alanyl-D-glutamate--2,6-diaminopimelate ligase